jgi:anti-sigma B factor antagonist
MKLFLQPPEGMGRGGQMEVIEKKQNGICILGLLGRLDSNTSPEFEKKIFEVIEDGTKSLIVDFESLDYISSAGLRVLLKATKELKRSDGKIVLCSMKEYIKEVFEIAGFVSLFPIVSSVGDAVEEF